jgi:hypothetical protein
MLPHSKEEVAERVKNQAVQPFEKTFAKGHCATNFHKWLDLVKMQLKADYYTISSSRKKKTFEPYILGYRPGGYLPVLGRVSRYRWNKISLFQECIAAR